MTSHSLHLTTIWISTMQWTWENKTIYLEEIRQHAKGCIKLTSCLPSVCHSKLVLTSEPLIKVWKCAYLWRLSTHHELPEMHSNWTSSATTRPSPLPFTRLIIDMSSHLTRDMFAKRMRSGAYLILESRGPCQGLMGTNCPLDQTSSSLELVCSNTTLGLHDAYLKSPQVCKIKTPTLAK